MSQYGPETKGQINYRVEFVVVDGDLNHNHYIYIEQHIRTMFIRKVQSSKSESMFTSLYILFGWPVMAMKP